MCPLIMLYQHNQAKREGIWQAITFKSMERKGISHVNQFISWKFRALIKNLIKVGQSALSAVMHVIWDLLTTCNKTQYRLLFLNTSFMSAVGYLYQALTNLFEFPYLHYPKHNSNHFARLINKLELLRYKYWVIHCYIICKKNITR
jgi:hypothetical protein